MKLSAFSLIIISFVFITNVAFASHHQYSNQITNLKFETLVQLPQPDVYQVSTGVEKAKFTFKFLHRVFLSYLPFKRIFYNYLAYHYSLPNYCLLRTKNYYLII